MKAGFEIFYTFKSFSIWTMLSLPETSFLKRFILHMRETSDLIFFLTLTQKTSVCVRAHNLKLWSVLPHKIPGHDPEPSGSAQMDTQDVWATFIFN